MSINQEFEKKAKADLDESVEQLNPDITRRLQQARYAALEKASTRSTWSFYPKALATAFTIAVISVSLFFNFSQYEVSDTVLAMETEMEMLSSKDSFELMEDLEFMEWLVEFEEYTG